MSINVHSIAGAGTAILIGAALAGAGAASADVPSHVKNFTFWRQSGIAVGVPASWMAANVTFVETGQPSNAAAFKVAGGRRTIVYSDPNYYYEAADYHSPGDFPESAYAHDPSGNRVTRPQGHGIEYYLLPNSPQALETYRRVTATAANSAYDYVFADGVSDTLGTSLYRMNAQPVEISSDRDYVEGMKNMLAAAARPVIVNGFNNGNPLNIETYVTAPNVAGIYGETCFHRDSGAKGDQIWHNDAAALLFATQHKRYAFCGGHGTDPDDRAERLYWLASWWLTYDPKYSVAVEVFASPGNIYVFPETQIVPTEPVQSPGENIDALRRSTGTYVREFRKCYQRTSAIGGCAAVVNASSSASAPIPQDVLSRYSRVLVLDQDNLFNGGTARFTHGVPIILGPNQGAVLAR